MVFSVWMRAKVSIGASANAGCRAINTSAINARAKCVFFMKQCLRVLGLQKISANISVCKSVCVCDLLERKECNASRNYGINVDFLSINSKSIVIFQKFVMQVFTFDEFIT